MSDAVLAERDRWLRWLAQIDYGINWSSDHHPPCTVRELAVVLCRETREGPSAVMTAEEWQWCIEGESGWFDEPAAAS